MNPDNFIVIPYVEKYWEVDQEKITELKCLRDDNGFYLLEYNENTNLYTLMGHSVILVGGAGISMVFKFSDGTKHKVKVDI